MLIGQLGIRLILWMGQTVPMPASYDIMNALTRVHLQTDEKEGDGFQISFTLGKDKTGSYSLLSSGALDPDSRVVVGVLLGASLVPLIDGVIYHQQVQPSSEPGMSMLTVSGRDISVMLDLEEKDEQFNNQSDSIIVTNILMKYAQYVAPAQIMPTTDFPIETERIPSQHETDLKFIKRLADRNGFVFYIEPMTMGVNGAYWGPENRLSIPQPALTMNMGASTNVRALDFADDALAPTGTSGSFVEPFSKTSIPIPLLPSLRMPPLSASPRQAKRTSRVRCTARQNPGLAATTALAQTMRASEPLEARGELDTVQYGHVLRPRRLVGVRGAGRLHDGNYRVVNVTHDIERGRYTQSFTLKREGTGSLAPVVMP